MLPSRAGPAPLAAHGSTWPNPRPDVIPRIYKGPGFDTCAAPSASARDAVHHAEALGIGSGNAIYFDMEGYSESATNRKAVLKFLAAWTKGLQPRGYVSGAHGSRDAGVNVLVSRWGSGYPEPDELLYSDWDGEDSTQTSGLPRWMWKHHQRIHQYLGPHDVDIGGHTLNIDNDAVNALTGVTARSSR